MKKIIAPIVALTLILGCAPIFPAIAESSVYGGPDPATADFTDAEIISGTYYANWIDPNQKSEQPTNKMGDVNGDTVVDTTDLALLKKYLADKENEDADQVINGNVDGEGEIDTTDLAILKKILANIYEAEKPSIDYEDPDVWSPPVGGEDSETHKIDYENPYVWTPPIGGEE